MHVFRIWHVLYLLGFVVASLCAHEIEYEGNYADNYDNKISEDQQEGESQKPCQAADFSRWDKLFIALEDSHMRQNMLMESLEQCCSRMVHLRTQVDKLVKGTCQQCVPTIESACRAQVEQVTVRLQQELEELREEEAEREIRLNATLQMLLRGNFEGKARLKRLEEDATMPTGGAESRMRHQPMPRPGDLGASFSLGMKPFLSGLKEQEVTTQPYTSHTMEKALATMATEVERVHLQLNRVLEQVGTLRKDRGDT